MIPLGCGCGCYVARGCNNVGACASKPYSSVAHGKAFCIRSSPPPLVERSDLQARSSVVGDIPGYQSHCGTQLQGCGKYQSCRNAIQHVGSGNQKPPLHSKLMKSFVLQVLGLVPYRGGRHCDVLSVADRGSSPGYPAFCWSGSWVWQR